MPHKTVQMKLLELQRGQQIEDLWRHLVEQGLTDEQIAANFGIARLTLSRWKKLLGAKVVRHRAVSFSPKDTASIL